MKKHKYNIFPDSKGDDFKFLYADIELNGFDRSQPITVFEDAIIDGWSRYRACLDIGITPLYKQFKGTQIEAIEFVMRMNKRRNLNSGQWACIANEAEELVAILKSEAKERQVESGKDYGRGGTKVVEQIPQPLTLPEAAPVGQQIAQQVIPEKPQQPPKPQSKKKPKTAEVLAKSFNTNERYVRDTAKMKEETPEIFEKVKAGEITVTKAKKQIQIASTKEKIEKTLKAEIVNIPTVQCQDVQKFMDQFEDASINLLITDPPYSTDIEDIKAFAEGWLPMSLKKVKTTGYAFIFIGAYPAEVQAYLNTALPTQSLVWEYKNTLGNNPKDRYKLNYQSILFYKMPDAGKLNIEITNEQWAVQSINAPDGRQGDRYHTWQKPMELAERLIRHTTKEGDIVVDPFCCTGTFLLAASKLNRIAKGGDNSSDNLKIAIQRGCKYA